MTAEPATAAQWRTLHSHWVDGVLAQHPDVADLLLRRFGGLKSRDFTHALRTGSCRVRSVIEHDVLVYRIEVEADDAWVTVSRPPATALGIADTEDLRDQEISFHAERLARELQGDPDDTDSPP